MAQAGSVQSETKASEAAAAPRPRSLWILGAPADLTLIVGTPVLIFAGFSLARQVWSAAAISSFVMIWAIGHHLPGMMRAYGDPELFRRFGIRFLVAPALLLAVCAYAFTRGLESGVISIAAIWGWWHYLMQTYGFVRIYDAKVGSFAATTRWLDKSMCLCWFAAAVVMNDNVLHQFLENFYKSGIRPPSPVFLDALRGATRGATIGVTALFIINLIMRYRRGESTSPIKVLLMISTFAAFWYSAATVTNIVVAYAFFELFHDVQYLTIVWAFNQNRVAKDKKLRGFTRFLFQPRVILMGLYVAMVFGYGSLKWGSQYVSEQQLSQMLAAVFLTSTMLHYYFDGFIWKLRESRTQTSLDIESQRLRSSLVKIPKGLFHALLWMLFVIPVGYLTVSQVLDILARRELTADEQLAVRLRDSEALAACTPRSVRAWYNLGFANEMNRDDQKAKQAYDEALALFPDFQLTDARLKAWYNLAIAHETNRDYENAAKAYEEALSISPDFQLARVRLASVRSQMPGAKSPTELESSLPR